MDAKSRRKIEMGTRALEFSRAHPDTDAGYLVAAGRLEQLMGRATEIATAQREGLVDAHAASIRKADLRRTIRSLPIAHLAEVGRLAAREDHELGKTFSFKPGGTTFLAFRTAARSMATAAQAHRELLVRHGLAESVLEEFVQLLDQFDTAVTLGNEGRTAHTGATRELRDAADEIARTVRVMDARNRQRFQADGQLLGSWLSASTVLGEPRTTAVAPPAVAPSPSPAPVPAAGEVRPAA